MLDASFQVPAAYTPTRTDLYPHGRITIIDSKAGQGMSAPLSTGRADEVARPNIGWFTATCVLVSNIVGGGIFTTTGFMARDLGDPILIISLWIVGGFLAMAAAMSYSELPAAMPRAGGDYVYLREAYGSFIGFLSGWTSFTVGFGAGIAAAAVSFSSYALRLVPLADDNSMASTTVALVLVWVMTAVHASGTGAGGRLQRVLTTTKVLAIVLLIFGGFVFGRGSWDHVAEQSPHTNPGIGPLMVALIFVLYTYLGWNVVGYIAGEIADPRRTIPRIVVGGTAFVALLYVLLNLVYLYALPVTALAQPPILPVAEKAAAALWGPANAQLVAGLLCVSIAGGVSAMVWAGRPSADHSQDRRRRNRLCRVALCVAQSCVPLRATRDRSRPAADPPCCREGGGGLVGSGECAARGGLTLRLYRGWRERDGLGRSTGLLGDGGRRSLPVFLQGTDPHHRRTCASHGPAKCMDIDSHPDRHVRAACDFQRLRAVRFYGADSRRGDDPQAPATGTRTALSHPAVSHAPLCAYHRVSPDHRL